MLHLCESLQNNLKAFKHHYFQYLPLHSYKFCFSFKYKSYNLIFFLGADANNNSLMS